MKRTILIVAIMSLMLPALFSQITIKLGNVENAEPGTNINVPLIVSGLSTAGQAFIGVEVLFNFQSNVLTYSGITNGHPLLPTEEWFAGSIPGKASANWIQQNLLPINVDDGSVILEFVFLYSGGETNMTFELSGTAVYDVDGNPLTISGYIEGTVTQAAGSESSIWNGTGSWTDTQNWSQGIPGDSTNAIINTGQVTINSGGVCKNLTVNSGTKLIIDPGYSLTVNGDYSNGSEVLIKSDTLIQGSLIIRGSITQAGISNIEKNVFSGINYQLSSPVTGAGSGLFDGAGTIKEFSEATHSWSEMSPNSTLEPATGYALEAVNTSIIVFDGPFTSESHTKALSLTSQGSITSEGWNFIGNPYSSSFNCDEYLTLTHTDRAIYTWDGYKYRCWNGTAGSIPGGIIPPMTGFFVKANNPGAGITFNKEGRVHDFSHFGSASANPENVLPLIIQDFDNSIYSDEAYIEIESASTFAYDGLFDAFKLNNHPDYPELYFLSSDQQKLAISTIPEATEVIAGVKIATDGTYQISALSTWFMPDRPVYVIDRELSITKDLRTENYVFNITAGDHPERFLIVMSGLGTGEPGENDDLVVFSQNGEILIRALVNCGKTIVCLYDLSGRILLKKEVLLNAGTLSGIKGTPGINILTIQTPGTVYSYKVPVRN